MDKEVCNTCTVLTINVAKMEEKIDNIIQKMLDNKSEHVEIMNKIEAYIDSSEKKFARKEMEAHVENIVKRMDDKEREENRKNYDWVKYAISTGIMFALMMLMEYIKK